MKYLNLSLIIVLLWTSACRQNRNEPSEAVQKMQRQDWAIVIHGGAGSVDGLTAEAEQEYRKSLLKALAAGRNILQEGGTALDAVERAINIMEDDSLFNAGKGAVFTHEGRNEMDASIMNGSDLKAGAVAAVTDIKNPISAARAVMTRSPHVLLSGAGASEFAREQGLEIVSPDYFYTKERWNALQETLKANVHGTVGCCALDKSGNLAAGTSTGGMTNKRYNRIGDTPIIGAGTYASNKTCAISCTGHGEFFIRFTVAHDISALMEYKGLTLNEAADLVINDKLVKAGGSGGMIGVDAFGHIAMTFNSESMFRAFATADGQEGVYVYKDNK